MAAVLVLLAGAVLPASLLNIASAPPRARRIHVEAYRYSFNPSWIDANRGDRLCLTFSTRDTGQSFLLQDYGLQVSITPGDRQVLVQSLARPDQPTEKTETVCFTAGRPGWQGWLLAKSTFRNHTYNGPLHGTERGDLIVAPNLLLQASLGLLCAIPLAGLILAGARPWSDAARRLNLFAAAPWLKRAMKKPSFQFNLILPMLAVFWLIILAGLRGLWPGQAS